ncbi:MAG: FkbM family methyltransferase [Elusimicrobia bacterium]|nr:FkbM family methyltransferase [Elusimicrobiota bacterium]
MSVRGAVKGVLTAVLPESAMMSVRKYHYRRKLARARIDEENDLVIAARLVIPRDVAADVGANYGLYTRFLSEAAGPQGRVYSVEPIPTTFSVLKSNVEGLGLANVRLVNCALSDHPGSVEMAVPKMGGGENFYQAHIVDGTDGAGVHKFKVELATLDNVLRSESAVAFIKIDVEGHELPCIRGASDVISRCAPALLIEVSGSPDHPGASSELFQDLLKRGYRVFASDGLALRPHTAGHKSVNYFFLRDNHLSRLAAAGVPTHA